ncbi:hypothetical protein I7I50_11417 [Histoplasma capsulatum G186AR]|uniref:Uncharacterized protein n=1 Tax=Ajellomyces capsulatus TaxID=5037 RepID=A0A8H8D714_AJECA|nr:hypothetical protein I7I52_02655 [Histoplasma capsulatum]QSS69953.1 hypothetical protein I7I50_11417 [Histoplasma capsulatum G186AR]
MKHAISIGRREAYSLFIHDGGLMCSEVGGVVSACYSAIWFPSITNSIFKYDKASPIVTR